MLILAAVCMEAVVFSFSISSDGTFFKVCFLVFWGPDMKVVGLFQKGVVV